MCPSLGSTSLYNKANIFHQAGIKNVRWAQHPRIFPHKLIPAKSPMSSLDISSSLHPRVIVCTIRFSFFFLFFSLVPCRRWRLVHEQRKPELQQMPWSGATGSLSPEGGDWTRTSHVFDAVSLWSCWLYVIPHKPQRWNSQGSRVANQGCTGPTNTRNKSQLDINLHFLIR